MAEAAASLNRPPVVIGHSMGGLITQKYLERHTAPAAVLLATIPTRGVLPFVTRLALRRPLTLAASMLRLSPSLLVATPELSTAAFFSESLPETTRRAYHDRLVEESFRMILDAGVLDLPRPRRISTPILVLGAENDTIFPPHEMRATARAYGAECNILADTAHDVMLEPRWEAGAGPGASPHGSDREREQLVEQQDAPDHEDGHERAQAQVHRILECQIAAAMGPLEGLAACQHR